MPVNLLVLEGELMTGCDLSIDFVSFKIRSMMLEAMTDGSLV